MASSDPQPALALDDSGARQSISELSQQLTQLNAKLVKSFERIADLEDELHDLSFEHEKLKTRNQTLELEASQHEEALKGGLLVESADVQAELQRLTQRALQEAEKRSQSEASLSTINKELDDMSASLFSEANRLVASEKLQRIKAERKVVEVEQAMKSVEEIIESRRDQLNDLRICLENAERERDQYKSQLLSLQISETCTGSKADMTMDHSGRISNPATPINLADPMFVSSHHTISSPSNFELGTNRGLLQPCTPGRSSSPFPFQQLLNPKIVDDILPYQEFLQFTRYLVRMRADLLVRPTHQHTFGDSYYTAPATASSITATPSFATDHNRNSTSMASVPTKEHLSISSKDVLNPVLPLTPHLSQPFLKRCVEEDSDPTLRLDIAPGLNFLSRRGILTALFEGHLVIEPVWNNLGAEYEKCALCGCSLDKWFPGRTALSTALRGGPSGPTNTTGSGSASSTMRKMLSGGTWSFGTLNRSKRPSVSSATFTPKLKHQLYHLNSSVPPAPCSATPSGRNSPNREEDVVYVHTFRTADTAASRYPICPTYCLVRLRSVCDFWTYVRSIQRGLLLDESSRFANRQSQSGSRTFEPHSLGLAYHSTLKMMKQQGKSVESVIDSPVLTHSISPSSKSLAEGVAQASSDALESVPPSGQSESNPPTPSTAGGLVITSDVAMNSVFPDVKKGIETTVDAYPTHPGTTLEETPSIRELGLPSVVQPPARYSKALSLIAPLPLPRPSPSRSRSIPSFEPSSPFTSTANHCQSSALTSLESLPATQEEPKDLGPREGHEAFPLPLSTPAVTPTTSSRRTSVVGSAMGDDEICLSLEGLEVGWEEKCWSQLIKLKEEMFYKRVGIVN